MIRRDRIVLFRLTQEEYRLLQAACAASGGRSISDFTRSEVLAAVHADSGDASIRTRLAALDQKIDALLSAVRKSPEEVMSGRPFADLLG